MKLHLLEHDPLDFSRTNITIWAGKKGYEIHQTYVCKMEPLPLMQDFDWLMVMGGSLHVWEEATNPWLVDEKAFIEEALKQNKIILGICFGAQLIAEALGGRVFPNTQKEIGWYPVTLSPESDKHYLFQGVPNKFMTFHWHSDHFSLPSQCTRLAYSDPTPNQASICNQRPVAGLQFHPEYTRTMIAHFAREHSEDWIPDRYVSGKETVIDQTQQMKTTYWLMEALLENMDLALTGRT